jgi:hypothetical protein
MKIGAKFYSRALFVAAFLLLIATNAFVLHGVTSNRSGPAEARLVLSERELKLPLPSSVHDEDSGLALNLVWRSLPGDAAYNRYANWRSPDWLDRQKLEALGFEMGRYLDDGAKGGAHYKRAVSKAVYIVLELDGPCYQEMLRRAEMAVEAASARYAEDYTDEEQLKKLERAEADLEGEHREKTRLFAIDAALDPQELRSRYQDRGRFIITRGRVKPSHRRYEQPAKAVGTIESLGMAKIHVPRNMRGIFDSLPAADDVDERAGVKAARYQVELACGSRLEPWIVAVSPPAEAPAPLEKD